VGGSEVLDEKHKGLGDTARIDSARSDILVTWYIWPNSTSGITAYCKNCWDGVHMIEDEE